MKESQSGHECDPGRMWCIVRLERGRQGYGPESKATKRTWIYLKGSGKLLIDFKQEKHFFVMVTQLIFVENRLLGERW